MFDYDPAVDRRTQYAPAPAWPTIVAADGTADRIAYETLKCRLLAQGDPFSAKGGRSGQSFIRTPQLFEPIAIDRDVVALTISEVMSEVCPAAVTQEQILRAAFVTRLPPEHRQAIGTLRSAAHPERATPSLYRHTAQEALISTTPAIRESSSTEPNPKSKRDLESVLPINSDAQQRYAAREKWRPSPRTNVVSR